MCIDANEKWLTAADGDEWLSFDQFEGGARTHKTFVLKGVASSPCKARVTLLSISRCQYVGA